MNKGQIKIAKVLKDNEEFGFTISNIQDELPEYSIKTLRAYVTQLVNNDIIEKQRVGKTFYYLHKNN